MEIDVAIRSYEIPHSWPSAVGEQAAAIPAEVAEKDKANRVDIRNMRLVTIDDESARDFDDAIYCEPRPRGGYRLVVAIADVSHYVRPGSPLDEEAGQAWQLGVLPGSCGAHAAGEALQWPVLAESGRGSPVYGGGYDHQCRW